MAHIDPPVLPPRLYRYRNVSKMELADRELDAIASNYLWFAGYRDLNDPMEGIYGASASLAKLTNFKRLAREILGQKRSVGMCCFSDTYDNELMWAHYAGNYSGICIEYSTNDLQKGLNDDIHIVRVAYNGIPPRVGVDYQRRPQQAVRTILSHKKACWQYEREWRLLVGSEIIQIPGPLHIGTKSPVKGVYLGTRIDDTARDKLVDKLSGMNIKIHTMKMEGYQHTWS